MKEYIDWFDEERDTPIKMIATWYGLEIEKYTDQKYFDLDNPLTDKDSFAKFINKVISMNVEGKFLARLENQKYSWLPSYIEEELKDDSIKKYLDRFEWKKKYYGKINIPELKEFMDLFLDFPNKFSYQDILIFAKKCDLLIVFSHHGTIWFLSKNKKLLNTIGSELQSLGVKVVYESDNKDKSS